ncbi:MAG TPA: phosphonate ABC transporter, permease protein PhnE [Hyphomicrobiaceae bacterium]|nr:phosphonate ABC transporter, permease protein PhnE [Hyphomicrobiaceae bacterium]
MSLTAEVPGHAREPSIAIPRRPLSERARGWIIWLAIAALLAWSWGPVEMYKIGGLITDWRNMAEFASGFMRPSLRDWPSYTLQMLETVQMALWGTALAVVFGMPFAILSAANVCPQWVVQPVRRLMDACRAINEIVFALLFVVAVGLGPLAGILALTIHNIGIVAKLFSEAVEAIDPRPVEGIRATGANRLQEVIFGVVPQVMPLWSSFTLYRFETNVRSATVLGIVGAGGIGQSLYENIRAFQYAETATIVIIVVITVMLIDLMSARIRKFLL